MAHSIHIIDLAGQSQVQLSFSAGDGTAESAPPVAFPLPLSTSESEEIEWYFTQYLDDPFGAAKARAEAVETGLKDLGRLLFEGVFRSSAEAQSILERITSNGLEQCHLSVVSSRREFLALPWELLNDEVTGYLANRLAGVSRRSTAGALEPFSATLPTTELNVLLLAPPVSNTGSSGSLAAEALGAMESLEAEVSLDSIRPVSLEALEENLFQHDSHYHLVQLDGFDAAAGGLVFPNGDGQPSLVTAEQLGGLLAAAHVPLVLLSCNAPAYAPAVASGLAQAGVPNVVLIPAPLTSVGRQLFIRAFYASLVQGLAGPQAAAGARKALMDSPHRPSAGGSVVSWDWITPLVFESKGFTPTPIAADVSDTAMPGMMPAQPEPEPHQLPRGGPYGLIGRHRELLDLERELQNSPVVLLAGDAGVGKSELALGLASWEQKTGGRNGGVFYSSFDVGAGLEKVLHETGTALAGLDFGDLTADDRRRWVADYLKENPTLLVWDGIENLAGFPTGAPGLLDDGELAAMNEFLAEVAQGGQSWVLLVSRRTKESWLSTPHTVVQLDGLAGHDRIEMGSRILEVSQVEAGRLGPEYLELLDMIEGHPLAIEIALPLLKDVPASVLLRELKAEISEHQPGPDEEARPSYLTVLMEHAFGRMSRRSRTHLPFLSLFRSRVMMDILTHITQEDLYRTVMGEQMGWGACRTLLRSGQTSGFLEPITPSVYQVHPSLPWFYGRSLYRQLPQASIQRLEAEFVRVYADTADYFMETLYENQDAGTTAILAEEGNITQALALALEASEWDNAQLLVQPLAQVFRMQKRYPELRRLRRQLLESAGVEAAEAEEKGAVELWLYLMGTQAGEYVETGELDEADEINQRLLAHLSSRDDGDQDPRTAAVYHQMGQVSQRRWRLDEAETWFTKSLAIIEEGEDRAPVADDYYGLGLVRQYQRQYTEAKEWFSKALDIHQRLEDAEEMVKDYRALGLCSQFKFEYEEASSWYERAREILEEARDEETSVLVYHSLGTVCHAQYQFDEAENWYLQSLSVSDRNGNEAQMAVEFHHLGLLAQAREIFFEDAEHWYKMALEKFEHLGDWKGAGDECRQLGVLFHEQKKLDEAEGWYNRAREIFEEIQDPGRITRTYGQLAMIAEERDDLPSALQWAGRTYQMALDNGLPVLAQAQAHLARLRDKHGEDNFAQWWREFAGEEPPTGLDIDPETIL